MSDAQPAECPDCLGDGLACGDNIQCDTCQGTGRIGPESEWYPQPEVSGDLDALLAEADDLGLYLAAAYNGVSFWPTVDEQRRTAREAGAIVRKLATALRAARAVIDAVHAWHTAQDGAPKLNAWRELETALRDYEQEGT